VSPNRVLVLMGSRSDLEVMEAAKPYYEFFGIVADYQVCSAHRQPEQTAELARTARRKGYSAIICGAGMAAHLAGICAAHSDLPVVAVPLPGGVLDGLDALLSSVQMPAGVPVATLTIGKVGAINSAVFTARILSLSDPEILTQLTRFREAGCRLPEPSP
jgi:phosphoribosylaminoimidazole carboxylase PurE protein